MKILNVSLSITAALSALRGRVAKEHRTPKIAMSAAETN
jgi:hypothetical protein